MVIAMPKSASTSFMDTLGSAFHIPATQAFGPCEGRKRKQIDVHKAGADPHALSLQRAVYLGLPHSDMCTWENDTLVNFVTDRARIYKQHLLPIARHVGVLIDRIYNGSFPAAKEPSRANVAPPALVLLTRDPREAALAYTRHKSMVEGMHGNKEALLQESVKHIAALSSWKDGWEAFAKQLGPDRVLVVTMQELVSNVSAVVADVAKVWDLRVPASRLEQLQLACKRLTKVTDHCQKREN